MKIWDISQIKFKKQSLNILLLGQVFITGLDAGKKQEGLLKRLKNIEDKADRQLEENKNNQLGIKSIGYAINEKLSQEAKSMFEKLNNKEELINYRKLKFTRGNKVDYDFTNFISLLELFKAIYHGTILIPGAEREQDEFNDELKKLEKYRPRTTKFKDDKKDFLINAQNFYDGRKMIIKAFKGKTFPLKNPANYPDYVSEKDTLTSSSDLSRSSPDLLISSSPKDAIAASSKSSPDLLKSISSRSSLDLSKSSDNEDSEKDKAFVSKLEKLAIDSDIVLDPELVEKYFYDNSLREIVKQLKDLRRQDNKLTE